MLGAYPAGPELSTLQSLRLTPEMFFHVILLPADRFASRAAGPQGPPLSPSHAHPTLPFPQGALWLTPALQDLDHFVQVTKVRPSGGSLSHVANPGSAPGLLPPSPGLLALPWATSAICLLGASNTA